MGPSRMATWDRFECTANKGRISMDTRAVARHYEALNPWERLSLTAAASARGDALEVHRLMQSAPRCAIQVSHHWGLAEAFRAVAAQYMFEQLSGVGLFWEARFTVTVNPVDAAAPECLRESHALAARAVRFAAFCFQVRAEAWKLFCADVQIDGDVILGFFPGHELLRRMAPIAQGLAYTVEDAKRFVADMRARRSDT